MAYGDIAEVTGDILLATDTLPDGAIDEMLYMFSRIANRSDTYSVPVREYFHANARLLAAVRDKRAADWKAIKRNARKPTGVEPAYG